MKKKFYIFDPASVVTCSLIFLIVAHTIILFLYPIFGQFSNDIRQAYNQWIFGTWGLLLLIKNFSKNSISFSSPQLYGLAFLFVCLISFCTYRKFGLSMLLIQCTYCFVFFGASSLTRCKDYRTLLMKLLRLFVIAFFCMTALAILFYYTDKHIDLGNGRALEITSSFSNRSGSTPRFNPDGTENRYRGFYEHPVPASVHAATAILFSLWLCRNKQLSLPFTILNVVSQLWMIKKADGRTGMVLLGIATILIILQRAVSRFGKKKTTLTVACCIGICISSALIFKYDAVSSLIISLINDPVYFLYNISSARTAIWSDTLSIVAKKPFFGAGWVNYDALRDLGWPQYPHNGYLNVLLFSGCVGFAAFTAFLISAFKRIHKNLKTVKDNNDWILFCTMIGIMFAAITDNLLVADSAFIETALFWILLGYFTFYSNSCPNGTAA